ncbi:hypothetical protein PHLCEN_2v4767 [Hermanssonia centrifuga]|uniref:Uncharacterized protein n=1 Tax=Hermanssonia centrifuga TaxID=98765 RepID=A0A2R6PJD6_9APHY|nr:hypothetical protein PHLCEN_2v4767 [Hermanssonia centrifuga]
MVAPKMRRRIGLEWASSTNISSNRTRRNIIIVRRIENCPILAAFDSSSYGIIAAQPYGYPQPIVPPQIPFPSGYPAFNGAPVVPPVPPAFTNQPAFNSEPVVPQVPFPEPERGAPVVPSHPGRDVEDMRVPIDPGQYGPRPSLFQRPKSLHFRRNPLPEPPRDVFESSPYVSLLRELRRDPEEKLHRSATLPHANGYIVTPPGQQYGSHSSRGHKERKGIFRSLSNAFGSKSRREPNRAGIPIVQPVVFAGPPMVQRTPIGTNFVYNTTPAQPPMAIPAQGTPASRMRSPVPSANVYRRDPSPAPSVPMYQRASSPAPSAHKYQRASSPAPSAHMYQRAPSPAQNAAMYQRASSPAQNAQTYQRGPSPAPLERARSPRVQRIDLSNEFAGLVHLSPHPITYDGKRYPSAFHLLEAMRFMEGSPDIAERVRNCGTVDEVRAVVHQASSLIRPDWEHIVVAKAPQIYCIPIPGTISGVMDLLDAEQTSLAEPSDMCESD